jgi:two-component system, NtrC family, response regulator AtoC
LSSTHKPDRRAERDGQRGDAIALLFSWGDQAQALALRDGQSLVVGRAAPAQLVIDHPSLSLAHARFSWHERALVFEDLGSEQGCLLNGHPMTLGRLEHDSVVRLGAVEVRIARDSRSVETVHASPIASARIHGKPSPPLLDAPVVVSARMRELYDLVGRAARSLLPVLVQGPTGSGKELIARALHEGSPRRCAAFKTLNCATIPSTLVESMLFGHERGAFTGAERQAAGVFEQAHGGTLFLDEVGELPAQAQAALLRVLEHQRVARVGATREIEVDVRVVAATHRDLRAMVAAGTFREDLLFRLDVMSVSVPPLCERREEILPLAALFLARARSRWEASALHLSTEAIDALMQCAWPGNVRQLKNAIERASVVTKTQTIELHDLPEVIWRVSSGAGVANTLARAAGPERTLSERVREFEVNLIREALRVSEGSHAKAARLLGVPRRTLTGKVHGYGLLAESSSYEGD